MSTYQAVAEREGAWWAVTVPELPGVFTQGRTWAQAQEMARDAIASMLDVDPEHVDVELVPILPDHGETAIEALQAARDRKRAAVAAEAQAMRDAIDRLKAAGVSVRDAGAILGISYQRVSQLSAGSSG
ncbi:type II toxin-antitoxin system HicB family antitoxin [Phytomonospora endophytica]|uniref:Putative RNase H-like HicB family nuclease n=1 Tax=Phytomonospora endophytica TaxID=714109 RepID=A0A841FIF1_9ACTN|nr:type II toxin-antitoxin system HicB family antitoxin [Phytomonospora endophytica]MBB6037121.1 putative RNase H-like HicB family nuclease [Phytomonospora endophytica]GIG71160.1 hypothetical protein Pen01_74550 [Phytomonospora endophytica]